MGKLFKTGLLTLISLIVLAAAGLYIFRNPLLQVLIGQQLSKQGLPLQSLAELDVSFSAFRLNGLTAGNNKELRLDRLLATWRLPDVLAGKSLAIEISGLQAAFDLDARPPLSSAQPMAAPSGAGISIPWLPDFSLKDSTIHLHSAAGNTNIALSGEIAQRQPDGQTIRLSVIASGALVRSTSLLTATLDKQGNLQGKITVSDGSLALPAAKITRFAGETAFSFAALQLQHIQTELALSGIHVTGKALAQPVPGQAGKNPATPSTSGDGAIDQVTLKGDIRASAQSVTGSLDLELTGGQLSAQPLKVQQLSVSLPIQIASGQDNWHIGLRDPGQIAVGKIDSGIPVHLLNALKFSISQANLDLVKSAHGWSLTHGIAVAPGNLILRADRAGSSAIDAQIHPGNITLIGKLSADENYRGRFTIADAGFALPQSQLQMKDISATVHLNDAELGTAANFAIGRLQHLASEPLFAALSISGSVRNEAADGKPALYALNIMGGVPDLRYLKISGQHALDSGNGMLKAEIVPFSFSLHGLQPGALSPTLAQLEEVSGHVSASTQFKWTNKGIQDSRAAFELRDLSFVRENVKLTNLNVDLHVTDLSTLSTPPRQTITAQRIDAGVPLENLLVSYHIEGTNPPRIALEQTQFSMLQGTVSVVPTIIDPAMARSDMLIRISNIDLESFFNLIKVDGLAGSGRLDGQIPLTLKENQVTITQGHLAARAPGTLRFQSEKASQLLASSGKEMNLLLQAAQDFHYTELSMDLDKAVTHDLVAKLSLLGNNPAVMDGRAFRLNIKLETDIDKILQTINRGYNISHEILRGTLKFHKAGVGSN